MNKPILIAASIAILATSCTKKEPLNVSGIYDTSNYLSQNYPEKELFTQMSSMIDYMDANAVPPATITTATLNTYMSTGTLQAATVCNPYVYTKMTQTGGLFAQAASASGNYYIPGDTTGSGGYCAGYVFNNKGLQVQEVIEKCIFNSIFYVHAANLLKGPVTLQAVDQALIMYGAKPSFANSGSSNVSDVDRDLMFAAYVARRDKNDGNGMYTEIKNDFLTMQSAVKAGTDYTQNVNDAVSSFLLTWEKASAACVINYCYQSTSKLSATNLTDSTRASGLHSISEAVGFVYGFKGVNQNLKKITDTEIDEILSLMNSPAEGNVNTYLFATDPVNQLPKLQTVITKLQNIYGFSNSDLDDFKNNWVTLQGR